MQELKVLILAYDFPPYNSIGSQRPASWYKYFKKFGVEPTVVTLHWDNNITNDQSYIIPSLSEKLIEEKTEYGKEIRVPFRPNYRDLLLYKHGFSKYAILRKTLSAFYYCLKFAFIKIDNTREILFASQRLLEKEHFDCILATGEPFVLFKYAHLLSKKHEIPWIADFRDAWTNNVGLQYADAFMKFINTGYFRKLEKKYIASAKMITTPSPSYKTLLLGLHSGKKIEVVYNGNDMTAKSTNDPVSKSNALFEIAYAGRIYGHQELEMFLEGFRQFIIAAKLSPKQTRVVFYGLDFYHDNKERLLNFNAELLPYLRTTHRLAYNDLLDRLKDASLLLLLSSKGANWLNAKIFDYLPLKRKVILVSNDHGILESIMNECNAGEIYDSVAQAKAAFIRLYREFEQNKKTIQQTTGYEKYSRENQAKVMIDNILSCVA